MNLNTEFYSINKKEEKEGFMNVNIEYNKIVCKYGRRKCGLI
jgi:hypothetical protein